MNQKCDLCGWPDDHHGPGCPKNHPQSQPVINGKDINYTGVGTKGAHAATRLKGLSTDAKARKDTPIWSGVLRYFPLAVAAIARLSKAGNDKHNPGQPLHWSRGKSNDHGDCLVRHQLTPEEMDEETGELHAAAVAWRALAQLQLLEEERTRGGAG